MKSNVRRTAHAGPARPLPLQCVKGAAIRSLQVWETKFRENENLQEFMKKNQTFRQKNPNFSAKNHLAFL